MPHFHLHYSYGENDVYLRNVKRHAKYLINEGNNMKQIANELAPCGVFCGACPSCGGIVNFYHYKCSKCGKEVTV